MASDQFIAIFAMVSLDISISAFLNNVLESDIEQYPAQRLIVLRHTEIKVTTSSSLQRSPLICTDGIHRQALPPNCKRKKNLQNYLLKRNLIYLFV